MELASTELKQYIEENHISISSGEEAIIIVNDYFKESSVTYFIENFDYSRSISFDYVLKFGIKTIALEMKLILRPPSDLNLYVMDLIPRLLYFLERINIDKITLVIFLKGIIPESFQKIR